MWKCKCIAYINLDSYSIHIRRDKLISKEREAILIRFDSETIKQYRIYTSNLEKYIKLSTITFFEDIKRRKIDLKLERLTSNELITRNLTKRSNIQNLRQKNTSEKIASSQSNASEKVTPLQSNSNTISSSSPSSRAKKSLLSSNSPI